MFFLGLLSTPLPYLLLAAFYFGGFAMGMFNNSTGDEALEPIAAITIPAEVQSKAISQSTFYYQINTDQIHVQADILNSDEPTIPIFPDTGTTLYHFRDTKVHEFLYSGFMFCRPPPVFC